jgi:CubicO group peptidase (beta-lactamase class C family)
MPDVQDYEWGNPQYDDGALERYVRSLSPQKLIADPGAKFAYSNMAFECLGALIAQVSGLPFDDYVKSHILDPAGMAESSFLKPDYLPANWAAPHVRILTNQVWEGYPYNRMHGPSSTLHSNAIEMCRWAITNLNRGSFRGRRVLSPASYDLLWKPSAQAGEGRQVGLSWFLEEYRGERAVQHGGGDIGFETYLMMLPDRRAAVVVLGNMLPAPAVNIAHAALDLLLGHEPDPIIPSASLVVGKTLAEQGLDAAVARWNALQADHPDAYDFGLPLDNLFVAVYMDRVAEAEALARLCTRLFPESELIAIDKELDGCQDLVAAAAVLRVIHER